MNEKDCSESSKNEDEEWIQLEGLKQFNALIESKDENYIKEIMTMKDLKKLKKKGSRSKSMKKFIKKMRKSISLMNSSQISSPENKLCERGDKIKSDSKSPSPNNKEDSSNE